MYSITQRNNKDDGEVEKKTNNVNNKQSTKLADLLYGALSP